MALLDPPEIVGAVDVEPIQVDALPINTWVQILGNDPQRLYFVVAGAITGVTFFVWPEEIPTSSGIAPASGQAHVLVHYASYPLLCQGPWFLRSSIGGGNFQGYAVRRH